MRLLRERRKSVICERCGAEMRFTNEYYTSPHGSSVYLRYICPHRAGEAGCGASRLVHLNRERQSKFRHADNGQFVRS